MDGNTKRAFPAKKGVALIDFHLIRPTWAAKGLSELWLDFRMYYYTDQGLCYLSPISTLNQVRESFFPYPVQEKKLQQLR